MSRPTYHQLEAMADFLVENPGIAKGVMRSTYGKYETKKKWKEAAITINALGGAQKDGKGWAKYWADRKCALKKTCLQQLLRSKCGGAVDEIPSFTSFEQRLVEVMGGPQFAAGDSNVTVYPSLSTSQPVKFEVEEPPTYTENAAETVRENTPSPLSLPRERSPVRSFSYRRQRARAGRTVLDQDRARFADIEARRVEAEAATARAFSRAVERVANLTTAIESLSTATREGAQTIAGALDRIAAALRN